MTYLIPIVGTHCAGKSTLAQKLTEVAQERGYKATFLQEVARLCPFPINNKQTEESTKWILEEQIKQENILKFLKFDVVFCDRSFADPLLYFFAIKENRPFLLEFIIENKKLCSKTFQQIYLEYNIRYKTTIFNFLSDEELNSVTDDGFRDIDLEKRKHVQNLALMLFSFITDNKIINNNPLSVSLDDKKHYNKLLDDVFKKMFLKKIKHQKS